MNWFRNLKIKAKLISCFVVLAVLTGVVGVIGISSINIVSSRTEDMYQNNFLPAQQLTQIQQDLLTIRSDYLLMLYEKDMSQFQQRSDEISTLGQEDDKILAEYENTIQSDEERNLVNTLKSDLETYRTVRTKHMAMIQAGQFAEARQKISELSTVRDQAEKDLADLIQFNEKTAGDKAKENTATARSQSLAMMIIMIVAILAAIGLGLFIAGLISKPIIQLVGAANEIADGDLDISINIDSKDEIGNLEQAFKKMTDNMNEVLTNIKAAAEQVASGSKQVSDTSIALSQGATEQASSTEQLTASLEEISSHTSTNAQNANAANNIAETAKEDAIHGNDQMKQMLKAMDEINESSGNISKIIKVIDEIAFQTNILALNAAVEAARAGQHGKGFAVVAEEVRNLAARSADAAKETTEMIEGSVKKVEDGTKIANGTADALSRIVEGVTKVAGLVNDIAAASNEQATGIAQINQGIVQISQVVQTNSATSEESAAASEELAGQAQLMKEQVLRFRLKKAGRSVPSYKGLEDTDSEVPITRNYAAAAAGSPSIMLTDKEFGKY